MDKFLKACFCLIVFLEILRDTTKCSMVQNLYIMKTTTCDVWDFFGVEDSSRCLTGSDTAWCCWRIPAFRRAQPPSSEGTWRWRPQGLPKHRYPTTTLHDVTRPRFYRQLLAVSRSSWEHSINIGMKSSFVLRAVCIYFWLWFTGDTFVIAELLGF
jgi:hypothetical protein